MVGDRDAQVTRRTTVPAECAGTTTMLGPHSMTTTVSLDSLGTSNELVDDGLGRVGGVQQCSLDAGDDELLVVLGCMDRRSCGVRGSYVADRPRPARWLGG